MFKFRVGDKVKIKEDSGYRAGARNHTVVSLVSDSRYDYLVSHDPKSDPAGVYFFEKELELENPPWGKLTPEEKGSLLLHHHEGGEVEYFSESLRKWQTSCNPFTNDGFAYRAKKPEPVVETVCLRGEYTNGYVFFGPKERGKEDTHKITFQTIDGEPDCSSIKMERISELEEKLE